jgi:hypothetical protein
MAISGFSPMSPLPAMQAGGVTTLPTVNPLSGQPLPNGGMLAAQGAVTEKPGIGSRIVSAMRAAVGELRGTPSAGQLQQQVLAMQAQQPVAVTRPAAATTKKPRTAKKVVHAKTWKTLAPKPAAAAPVATQPTSMLPANATQLQGATVYSYDQNGNPVMAPTMAQLGVNPQMLAGITGAAEAVDPSGPQVNATNQTNISGNGTGVGSAVPVLGAPIISAAPATASGDTPAGAATGGTQAVTNRNDTDVSSRNQGLGYGGFGGYDPAGGLATPYSPYGSSMTGAYTLGTEKRGFFSRLLGL